MIDIFLYYYRYIYKWQIQDLLKRVPIGWRSGGLRGFEAFYIILLYYEFPHTTHVITATPAVIFNMAAQPTPDIKHAESQTQGEFNFNIPEINVHSTLEPVELISFI